MKTIKNPEYIPFPKRKLFALYCCQWTVPPTANDIRHFLNCEAAWTKMAAFTSMHYFTSSSSGTCKPLECRRTWPHCNKTFKSDFIIKVVHCCFQTKKKFLNALFLWWQWLVAANAVLVFYWTVICRHFSAYLWKGAHQYSRSNLFLTNSSFMKSGCWISSSLYYLPFKTCKN